MNKWFLAIYCFICFAPMVAVLVVIFNDYQDAQEKHDEFKRKLNDYKRSLKNGN